MGQAGLSGLFHIVHAVLQDVSSPVWVQSGLQYFAAKMKITETNCSFYIIKFSSDVETMMYHA